MKYLTSFVFGLSLFAYKASFALAQASTTAAKPVQLKNPLKVGSITELLTGILEIVITLSVPVIVFFIIYAGYLYVTARGNAAQVEEATRALTYAIIGGVIIIGAVTIAAIVKNLVSSF
jgi:Type IV secretion system pilin